MAGGTITTDSVYLDNNEVAAHNYLANQIGSNLHLFATTDVDVYLPKAIVNDSNGEECPIVGVDHLGTYTSIGGPLHRRYVYFHIPEGYTFIGHEAFNFSTLNHMKDTWDQKYKFRVNYAGTAAEFIDLINNSKSIYEQDYVGVKKEEMEVKTKSFLNEVDNTGGIFLADPSNTAGSSLPLGRKRVPIAAAACCYVFFAYLPALQ